MDNNNKKTVKPTKTVNTKTTVKDTSAVGIKAGRINFSSEAGIGLPVSRFGTSYKKAQFIPYSGVSSRYYVDNLYPQQLANFAYNSPTNSAAIERKSMMIKGEGFNMEILSDKFRKVMDFINEEGESANDILEKVGRDYAMFGGISMKVRWGNDGLIKFVEHLPFEQVRVGMPNAENKITYYVVSNNWTRTLTGTLEKVEVYPAFNPNVFGESSIPMIDGIPTPSDEQLSNGEQVIYWFDKRPAASDGMLFYPIPDYAAALDAIGTEIEILISNKSLLDNGFGGKTILTFPYKPETDEEMDELDSGIKESFTKAKNNGGVIALYGRTQDELPTVSNIEALKADTYLEVDKNIKQSIISGHRIPAILCEYNYGGGFNNRADEMTVAYDQFQKTTIKSYQQKVIAIFKILVQYMGFPNEAIEIIPFTLDSTNTSVSTQSDTSLTTN